MKNLLRVTFVILPMLMVTSSHAGVWSKTAKGIKEAKEAIRVDGAFAFDPFIGRIRVAPFGSVKREVKILGQLRERATRIFNSNLSSDSKHSMINELNDATENFRKNPLKMDSEWRKKAFVEQQTKILDYYSRRLRDQGTTAASTKSGSRNLKATVGSR